MADTVRRHVGVVEWLLLAAAAPLLLFPSPYTLVGAGLIAAAWVTRRIATGRWSVSTAAHWPVRLLLMALLLSLVPSTHLDYSAPKFWGLILGLATFYACLHAVGSDRSLRRAAPLLLLFAAMLALVGVFGMGEPADKGFIAIPAISLPHLVGSVQSSTISTNGFAANEVGGILTLFLPVAASLLFAHGYIRWIALPVFLLVGAALMLTHSRAAAAGALLALFPLVLLLRKRVALAVVLALGTLTAVFLVAFGRQALAQIVAGDGATDLAGNLVGRAELWGRAVTMLVDMPITGIGLNNFPVVLRQFYPTVHHEGWATLPHAHNLFLQTGLDFGLLGLGSFLALVVLAIRGGLAAIRANEQRGLAAGLLLGLLAHGIYSLVDAVTLGSKPGPALWAVLGLLIAIGIRARAVAADNAPTRFPRTFLPSWTRSVPARAGVVAVLALALAAPVALNGARLILHGSWPSAAGLLDADLGVADALAWGPYRGRVWAARALAAQERGDQVAESKALETAFDAAPWDASVGLRLGDLRWERGERDGAVEAWRAAGASEVLIERGRQAQSLPTALDWFAAAQSVDPLDWQSYATAAARLEAKDPQRSAELLAEALRVRGSGVARQAVTRRLLEPELPLPSDPITVLPSPTDAGLFSHAARLLAMRGDRDGAFFAAQLAAEADPSGPGPWSDLATLWQAQGRPDLAQQARAHTAAPH